MQHPNHYRAVSTGADIEGDWAIRGHLYADSASRTQQSTQIICNRSKGTCESLEDSNEYQGEKRIILPKLSRTRRPVVGMLHAMMIRLHYS